MEDRKVNDHEADGLLANNSIIARVPKSHRYVLTPTGRRVALHFSKVHARVLRPVLHRRDPSLPDDATDELRRAWNRWERALDSHIAEARMAA